MSREVFVDAYKVVNHQETIYFMFDKINTEEFIKNSDEVNISILEEHLVIEYIYKDSVEKRIILVNVNSDVLIKILSVKSIGINEIHPKTPLIYYIK